MNRTTGILLGLALGVAASPAFAQSVDEALRLYKQGRLEDATFAFFDIMQSDPNPDNRDQAEIYLAEALRKQQLFAPALFYYADIFATAGRGNRYYLNSIEGLLDVEKEMHDNIFVPALINNFFDAEGFGRLDPDRISHINYMIGQLSFRIRKDRDAKAFLEFVPPESPLHYKARYVLGVLEARAAEPYAQAGDMDAATQRFEAALRHFQAIEDGLKDAPEGSDLYEVRNLATVAAARTAYGLGRYEQAIRFYNDVPRFSEQWFTSMYENAWAYVQTRQYGKALGELESVLSPYFAKRHVPEAYVIQGVTYFANCQWDRVRGAIERFKHIYFPMRDQLSAYLAQPRAPQDYYNDVVNDGGGKFSIELAREVRRPKQFRDYHFMLTHMDWERKHAASVDVWKGSRLAQDIAAIIGDYQAQLVGAAGQWVQRQLSVRDAQLKHFASQLEILDFEVTDAERKWLEQGKEILKGRRARQPRPDIPNDQWQHWSFDEEYWLDELGFIEHSLASECFDEEMAAQEPRAAK